MADEKTLAGEEKTEGKEPEVKAEPERKERTFTQEEVNKFVGEARTKERSKYEHYDEYKEQAAKARSAQDELAEARKELSQLKQEKQVADWKSAISKDTGVPVSILRGATEEELKAHAEEIKKAYAYPKQSFGENPKGEKAKTSDDRIKDVAKRLAEEF